MHFSLSLPLSLRVHLSVSSNKASNFLFSKFSLSLSLKLFPNIQTLTIVHGVREHGLLRSVDPRRSPIESRRFRRRRPRSARALRAVRRCPSRAIRFLSALARAIRIQVIVRDLVLSDFRVSAWFPGKTCWKVWDFFCPLGLKEKKIIYYVLCQVLELKQLRD